MLAIALRTLPYFNKRVLALLKFIFNSSAIINAPRSTSLLLLNCMSTILLPFTRPSLIITAVEIIFRGKNSDSEKSSYEEKFANPLKAAERGYVDDIIMPSETRARISNALKVMENKFREPLKKRHDNLPL